MMIVGFALVGFAYGPIGTVLAELFPTAVRYTGSSLTYNFAGIVGASLAPYVATWLATNWGLALRGLLPVGVGVALAVRAVRVARNTRHLAVAAPAAAAGARFRARPLQPPGRMSCPAVGTAVSSNTVAGRHR